MLRRVGVGAGDEHAEVGDVGEGVPDLLTVDDPLVAVADRLRGEAGEVGTGARLGEQLAPDLLAGEHRTQEAFADLVAAVGGDGRPGEGHEERRRIRRLRAGGTEPTLDELVQVGPHAEPAEALGEVHPGQAGVVASAAERDVVGGLRIVRREQRVERRLHSCGLGIGASCGRRSLGHCHAIQRARHPHHAPKPSHPSPPRHVCDKKFVHRCHRFLVTNGISWTRH